MTEPSPAVNTPVDWDSPIVRAAVAHLVQERVTDLLCAASDRMDAEADARLRRGHDIEHIAGWHEAALWQRLQAQVQS